MEFYSNRPDCWYKDVCRSEVDCNMCVRFEEMKHLMETSNLPKNKQKPITLNAPECDLQAYRRLGEIKSNIEDFVQSGGNLYITSANTGNGKTSWAIKLLLKYFDTIWAGNGFNTRALFIHVPTFLIKCKDFKTVDPEFENLKRKMLEVDLVVWDDLASTNLTSYDFTQLLAYIDFRTLNELSNIYTGNCESKEILTDKLGEKMASRIWNNHTEIVILKGGDQR